MLVHGRSWRYGVPGRRSRSGERSRPGREGRHEHLRSWGPVAQRGMRPNRIVMASPALDDDLSFSEWVEDLAIQQLVPQTSVTPMARIASATGVPCETRTSTWRSLDTISSGVCLFWRNGRASRPIRAMGVPCAANQAISASGSQATLASFTILPCASTMHTLALSSLGLAGHLGLFHNLALRVHDAHARAVQ